MSHGDLKALDDRRQGQALEGQTETMEPVKNVKRKQPMVRHTTTQKL